MHEGRYGLYVDAGLKGSNGAVDSPFTVHPRAFARRQRGRVGLGNPVNRDSFTEDGGQVSLGYSDIRRWIEDRRITPYGGIDKDALAFAITASILREGVLPTNWIEDAIDSEVVADIIGEAHSIATEMTLNDALEP